MFRLVGGTLCAILALIGILNFINSITTSILSRYREIAMLQSVGMTGWQVKQILIYEGIGYSILGLLGSLILSVIASLTMGSDDGCGINLFYMAFYPASGISLYYPSAPHYSHCSFGLL